MLRSSRCLSLEARQIRRVTCCCLYTQHKPTHQISRQVALGAAGLSLRPAGLPLWQQQQQHQQHQQQQQHQLRQVRTQAVQVDLLLGGISGAPGWVLAVVLVAGVLLGLAISKLASGYLRKSIDPYMMSLENAELRTKVDELQQLVLKVQPLAYKSMKLRFTKGINKAVILAMVDQMLANKEVNIWWLPDSLERVFYFNMMTLMLSVLDEVVDGMSMSLAGHNVRLQLTYLDVARDGEEASKQAKKTEEMLKRALAPAKTYPQNAPSGSGLAQAPQPPSSTQSNA